MIITRGASVGNASISWNSIKSRLECCTQCVRNFHGQCSAILPVWRRTGALLYGFMVDLLDISIIHPSKSCSWFALRTLLVCILGSEGEASCNELVFGQREAATYCDPFAWTGIHASKSPKMGKNPIADSISRRRCVFVTVSKLES